MRRPLFLVIVLFFLFLCTQRVIAKDETLTITTYYPSPYGVYNELRARKIAIGDSYINSAHQWGTAFSADADLVVEGNVGIGNPTPQSLLDVTKTIPAGPATPEINYGEVKIGNGRIFSMFTEHMGMFQNTYWKSAADGPYKFRGNEPAGIFQLGIGNQKSDILFQVCPKTEPADSKAYKEVMRMAEDGNIGIGTADPQTQLHLNQAVNAASDLRPFLRMEYRLSGISDFATVALQSGGAYTGDLQLITHNDNTPMLDNGIQFITNSPNVPPLNNDNVRMYVTADGRVGIGTMNPGDMFVPPDAHTLQVAGPVIQGLRSGHKLMFYNWNSSAIELFIIDADNTTHSMFLTPTTSSRKLKTDISDIEVDTSLLYKLRPVSFYYKSQQDKTLKPFGLIAEEVEPYFPQLVMRSSQDNEINGLDYDKLSVLVLKELQELRKEHDSEVAQLKLHIEKLESKITALDKGSVGK